MGRLEMNSQGFCDQTRVMPEFSVRKHSFRSEDGEGVKQKPKLMGGQAVEQCTTAVGLVLTEL